MPGSTYSTNLKVELMATGENSGTWGDITNTNLGTALEQAIVGYGNPNYSSDANLTISITNSNAAQAARALVLNVTSSVSLTATRELVVPTIQKQYIVQNNTTGSQSITVKTSAGTGITVPNGRKAHLYVDGTNVIQMFDFVDINGGAIDGTPIGASSASTGAFTTLNASGATTLDGNVTLGNASGDNVTVTGTITSNLLFTDNTYDIGANGATRPRNLFLAGAATIGGNLSVGGTLTLTGGVNLNGNVTVGDNASDTLTINSTITSNLLFTDNTYDIGASGATRPRNLFLAGNATVGGNQTLTGSLTVDSTTDSTSTITGSIQTDGGMGVAKALFVGTTLNVAGSTTLGDASGDTLTINGTAVNVPNNLNFDSNTLFIDATNNRVGVNTNGPSEVFEVFNGRIQNSSNNATAFDTYQTYASAFPTNEKYWRTQPYTDGTAGTTVLRYQFVNDAYGVASTWMNVTRSGIALTGVVFNEDSNDADFRIESDGNTHAFFLDGGVSTVNINYATGTQPSGATGVSLQIGVLNSSSQIFHDGTTADKGFVTGTASDDYIIYANTASGTFQNRLQIVNGGELVINQEALDRDTRIETTGRSNAFFVDASANTIGINNNAPVGDLDVIGTVGVYLSRAGSVNSRVLYLKQFNDFGYSFNVDSASTGKLFIKAVNSGVESDLIEWDRTNIGQANYGSAVFNEGGGSYNFRVESDNNQNMFYVAGGTDQVVIGGTTPASNSTLTVYQFGAGGSPGSNNAQIMIDANANSGSGQAALKLLAGSGTTNRAARIDFLNGVNSTTTPQWTFLNDYNQNGANDFNLIRGTADQRMVLYSGETVFNESSADVDFRVESDTSSHAFFVDAGNSRIGVNLSTPLATLDVAGVLRLDNGTTQSNYFATLQAEYNSSNPFYLKVENNIGGTAATVFGVYSPGGGGSLNPCFPLNSATGVGIGTTTPSYQMDFGGGTTTSRRVRLQRGSDDTGQNMLIGWDGIDVTRSNVALSSPQTTFSINQVGSNGTRNVFYVNTDGGIIINEDSYDADFRVESDTNTHALFVDAGNSKVAINSATVQAGAALNVYNGGILNYTEYALSGTSPVALGATMTGGIYVIRDNINGSTCLVLYENGSTPIIVSQSASNFTTGTPSGVQVKLSANAISGISGAMASGQSTTLRVMALICDPD